MANEITITGSLKVSNGGYVDTTPSLRIQDDQSTLGGHSAVVSVGTSEETVPTGDVTSEGWLAITNLDATNYVEYGPDSTGMVALGRLEPGHTHILKLKAGVTVKWQANTAAVKVKMLLLDR